MERDAIEIALDDHDVAFTLRRSARRTERVEKAPLGVHGRGRRVEILRLAGDRVGRDHQTVAIEIVEAALAALDEPGLLGEREIDAFALQFRGEPIPAIGRVTELELPDRLGTDPAPRTVRAARLAFRFREQDAMEILRGHVVCVVDRFFFAAHARLRRIFGLEFDPGALRQHAHRIDEVDVVVQLHEPDHVAGRVAAEALEEPAVGVDVKRRGLLAVKRAQSDQIVAALAQ